VPFSLTLRAMLLSYEYVCLKAQRVGHARGSGTRMREISLGVTHRFESVRCALCVVLCCVVLCCDELCWVVLCCVVLGKPSQQ
jgi:hypothetical protein